MSARRVRSASPCPGQPFLVPAMVSPSYTLRHKSGWCLGLGRDRGEIGCAMGVSRWTRQCGVLLHLKVKALGFA